MKSLLLCAIFFFLPLVIFSQEEEEEEEKYEHHCFFEDTSIMTGLGLTYSPDLEAFGVNGGIYYTVHEQVFLGVEGSYFQKDEEDVIDLNLVGHYIFETKWFGIYPTAGLNYTIENKKSEHEEKEREEAFGFIYGVGLHRNFGRLTTFAEYTRVASELSDQFITIGLMFNFPLK